MASQQQIVPSLQSCTIAKPIKQVQQQKTQAPQLNSVTTLVVIGLLQLSQVTLTGLVL